MHTGHPDQVQRLLIALWPKTYVRPHQHSQQWEMLALQRGGAEVLAFAPDGTLTARHRLDPAAAVDIYRRYLTARMRRVVSDLSDRASPPKMMSYVTGS